jgi:cellulose synthase/poly-beta-1,6-N-acetylglucosamine synthase-like glycosyltransferase
MLMFFLSVTVFCLVLVVYPYIVYPAGLYLFFPKKTVMLKNIQAGDGGDYSLLFCAYNEIGAMPEKLANVRELKARYPKLEVLAFDDGSRDGTADYISENAPFVRLIRGGGRNGKAHGMKLLAASARGRFLVFTDANVLLDINALDRLQSSYADESIGGVCGALHYLGASGSATAAMGGLYWRIEEKIKDLESVTGSVIGADGSIFSIRRELYPEFPDTVLDDFTVSMEVVFRGLRLIKSNEVIAYERLVSDRSDEFSRKIRIAARAFHTHASFAEKRRDMTALNRYKYFSHKTIRWFGGAFFLVGAVSAIITVTLIDPLLGFSFAASCGILVIVGLKRTHGVLSSFVEIILAMLATLVGVYRAKKGQTFSVWNPAKSR